MYGKVQFKIPVGSVGDCWDRYWVHLEEIRQSMLIIEQLIDSIPDGKHLVMKLNAKLKVPVGSYYSHLETARGIFGVFVVADGTDRPYRIHLRTPNFNNIWSATVMAPGWRLADLVTIISSLDIVVPDMDR